jgi:hypothetical protein
MKDEHNAGAVEAIVVGALMSPGSDELAAEYAQLGLDGIIDGDTFSELPVAKSVIAVARMGIRIPDRLFARKLLDSSEYRGQRWGGVSYLPTDECTEFLRLELDK